MIDNAPIAYGKDELTFSINLQENKAEDWMADWSGRVVVEGKTYFLNGYIKKEGWVAGKLKPEQGNINIIQNLDTSSQPGPSYNDDDDVIPF
jgi:hypothetical protein